MLRPSIIDHRIYVNNFSDYNVTYGAIGGVFVGLVSVRMVNLSLLLGAGFAHVRQVGTRIRAHEGWARAARESRPSLN